MDTPCFLAAIAFIPSFEKTYLRGCLMLHAEPHIHYWKLPCGQMRHLQFISCISMQIVPPSIHILQSANLGLSLIQGLRQHARFNGEIANVEHPHHSFDLVASENAEQIVFQAQKVSRWSRVALSARAPSAYIVPNHRNPKLWELTRMLTPTTRFVLHAGLHLCFPFYCTNE